jgi:hypothetical protein
MTILHGQGRGNNRIKDEPPCIRLVDELYWRSKCSKFRGNFETVVALESVVLLLCVDNLTHSSNADVFLCSRISMVE